MIIVEGFDGSGKSTLAEKIAEWTGFQVYHTGGPTRSLADVRTCLARSIARMNRRIVQDRVTHISESVYSMFSDPEKAALALSRMDDLRHARLLIYCRPTKRALFEALAAHEDKAHDTAEHMEKVRARVEPMIEVYDTVIALAQHHVNTLVYDRNTVKDDVVMNLVTTVDL